MEYRGFTASPIEGTPQGLAVYQNGVRINEVFGDTVNWDLIPPNAINGITVISGNPLYGLNALGGALNIAMKDGFSFQGVESDTRAGSWGRFQEMVQAGKQVDNFAAYVAIDAIRDSGWRQFSPSDVKRMYADLGVRDKDTEFHINFTGAENRIGVVGPTPTDLLGQNYNAVFTSPQTTENQLAMLSANGSAKLSDNWTVSGAAYLRSYHQSHVDGNLSSVAPCNQLNGLPTRSAARSALPANRQRDGCAGQRSPWQSSPRRHLRPQRHDWRDRLHHQQYDQLRHHAAGDGQGKTFRAQQHLHRGRKR